MSDRLADALAAALPLAQAGWARAVALRARLEPYHGGDVAEAAAGLAMAFFGGHFATTIAFAEGFRLGGYDRVSGSLQRLAADYRRVVAASAADDREDADGDGVADVEQIPREALARRKIALALRTVDPAELSETLKGLNAGCLAILATLRVRFAQAVTLGTALGDHLERLLRRHVQPWLERLVPEGDRKWVALLIKYAAQIAGVSVAWAVQRVLTAAHSALRGGQLVAAAALSAAHRHGLLQESLGRESAAFTAVSGAVAAAGCYWQVRRGFHLPFPLNVALFPLSCVEWVLAWGVSLT